MQTWVHVLEWRATGCADELAIVDDAERLSYDALLARCEARAGGWAAAGIGPGDVVAVLSGNTAELVAQVLGLCRLGAIPLLLNWRMTGHEVARLFELGQPTAVFADERSTALVPEEFGGPRVTSGSGDEVWTAAASLVGPPPPRPVDRLRSAETAILMHTSGTTGDPKLIPLDHGSLIRTLSGFALDIGTQVVGSRHLIMMPMFHLAGFAQAMQCFLTGGTLYVHDGFDVGRVIDAVQHDRVNFFTAAPTIIDMLTTALEGAYAGADMSSLIEVQYGAAPITPELLERALVTVCPRFRQIYGSTELQGFLSILRPEDHQAGAPELASAGQIALGWEAKIVGPDGGDLPAGSVGELLVRAEFLVDGYWQNPDETAAAFTSDGWYRTGDLATIDERRYLRIVGRAKDMVISGGENVYPAEIERVLLQRSGVIDAAVVGRPDPKWGERPVAFVVVDPTDGPSADELVAHCTDRLAGFKRPSEIILVDELPRNTLGKILKTELRHRLS